MGEGQSALCETGLALVCVVVWRVRAECEYGKVLCSCLCGMCSVLCV